MKSRRWARYFTFQSGYIQMMAAAIGPALLIFFTFQSGYIQINPLSWFNLYRGLYIPIWLYSNPDKIEEFVHSWSTLHSNLVIFKCMPNNLALSGFSLYIPIWLYSNIIVDFLPPSDFETLHSNLVIFKCKHLELATRWAGRFTFQSGYIQINAWFAIWQSGF